MGLTPTQAALSGRVATALAIFGGGLAVQAYGGRRDRYQDRAALQAVLMRRMGPLWETPLKLGVALVQDLKQLEAARPGIGRLKRR